MTPKTEFQKALVEFDLKLGHELVKAHSLVWTTEVGNILPPLIDLRNAEATLKKASRLKTVKPEFLAHLRSDVRLYRGILDDCLETYSDPDFGMQSAKLLKIAEGVLTKVRRFVAETFPTLATVEDVAFVKDKPDLYNDAFVAAVCDFICYDKDSPKNVLARIWGDNVPLREVPNTSSVRIGKPRYINY